MAARIKREMKRRRAIEPVVAHFKNEHGMECNCLAGRSGDASNAVLAAAGYNFRLLIKWLRLLLLMFCRALNAGSIVQI